MHMHTRLQDYPPQASYTLQPFQNMSTRVLGFFSLRISKSYWLVSVSRRRKNYGGGEDPKSIG